MFSMSRFNQLLQFFPRTVFHRSVQDSGADRYAKSFRSWDLLMVMLYGQLRQVESLRTLITGFNLHQSHHYHLHTHMVRRSTCADALATRCETPFRITCEALMGVISRQQRNKCKQLLCIMDSTVITLKGFGYDEWAAQHRTPATQGLKIHVAIDAEQDAPTYAAITPVNVNDLTKAKQLPIVPGMTYILDKGYYDYNWWHTLNQAQARFITRLKTNASYRVMRTYSRPNQTILSDEVIQLANKHPGGGRRNAYADTDLRRIAVYREDHDTPLVIVTNDFKRTARAVADLYRQRWQIELLFKGLKQKLRLKRYFGYSENAVRIQIYCALIAYLLMVLYKQNKAYNNSLSTLAIELRHGLFHRPNLNRYYYHKRKHRERFIQNHQGVLPI